MHLQSFVISLSLSFLFLPNLSNGGFVGGQCNWYFGDTFLDGGDGVGCGSLTDTRIITSCVFGWDEDYFTGTPGIGYIAENGGYYFGDGDPFNGNLCPNIVNTLEPCSNGNDQYYYYPPSNNIEECIDISGNIFTYRVWVSDFCYDEASLGNEPIQTSWGLANGRTELWDELPAPYTVSMFGLIHPHSVDNQGPPLANININGVYNPIEVDINDNSNEIALNPSDIDGDIITCRKATADESSIPDIPAGLSDFYTIDENTCVMTVDGSTFDSEGDIKMVQIMMETVANGDKNPVELLLVGRDGGDLSQECIPAGCEVRIESECINTPCDCTNMASDDYDDNCMVSQPNDVTVCCSQCEWGYWQLSHNSLCIPCDSSTVGDGCMFCQFENGCGQCQQGYTRTYDEECEYWICV